MYWILASWCCCLCLQTVLQKLYLFSPVLILNMHSAIWSSSILQQWRNSISWCGGTNSCFTPSSWPNHLVFGRSHTWLWHMANDQKKYLSSLEENHNSFQLQPIYKPTAQMSWTTQRGGAGRRTNSKCPRFIQHFSWASMTFMHKTIR